MLKQYTQGLGPEPIVAVASLSQDIVVDIPQPEVVIEVEVIVG